MSFTNPLAYFVLSIAFFFFSRTVAARSEFFCIHFEQDRRARYPTIHGIRGFLALGVFFHHGVITYYYHMTGVWGPPPSPFYTTLGEFAVALFFMITAFLFWGKVLAQEGPLDALSLFHSRNRRLTPLYVFSVLLVLLIVAVKTEFTLRVPFRDLVQQVIAWFSYGLLAIPRLPDINGLKDTFTIESVYWTLTFEWEFYLLLPLLSRLPYRTASAVALLGICAFLVPGAMVTMNFALGIIAAHWTHKGDLNRRISDWVGTLLMLVTVVAVFLLFDSGHGPLQYLLGFVIFMLLVNGNSLFGLLVSRPAAFLGTISYGIYLLHNIALFVMFALLRAYWRIDGLTPERFWLVVGLTGLLVILASALTYRFVEYPYLARRVDAR